LVEDQEKKPLTSLTVAKEPEFLTRKLADFVISDDKVRRFQKTPAPPVFMSYPFSTSLPSSMTTFNSYLPSPLPPEPQVAPVLSGSTGNLPTSKVSEPISTIGVSPTHHPMNYSVPFMNSHDPYTSGSAPQSHSFYSPLSGHDDANLFVFHLPATITTSKLAELFSRFGPLKSVKVMVDAKTNESRGFGFVQFFNIQDALSAIDVMNGYPMENKHLKVAFKDNKKNQIKRSLLPRSSPRLDSLPNLSYSAQPFGIVVNSSSNPNFDLATPAADADVDDSPPPGYMPQQRRSVIFNT